ncbi:Ornithine carbamoyltransferase [Wickerhamomyces ciferrii]|uniref:ornithine carbamoyltransferase n=1 Tax=Wickerhamomyces ciferrii (strain ATCC 14091 / BCRC 22168 / CBS 111 / JCM 3599 / NBRC 0793 / NRRL Y-1031 F-60-10) TaxID=1206466 RepID=K0KLQ9_WICCF|nr:Ornithine carbamoyltransferase [Wickerhamomyces ciferrii]CCH42063.1 Ornithine carbamoyltransferase [Wickerhamomyces ciferrii]
MLGRKGVRHLISISDLTNKEFEVLVNKAQTFKQIYKNGSPQEFASNHQKLLGKTVALVFSKRSTRTRISSEGAAAFYGATPMFLGKDDIQLGVNESFYDTTKVLSSMVSTVFARVNSHSEIQQLAEHSSVPILNSLCDTYHPLQAIADLLTIKEAFQDTKGLKLAWIGDANNVINDLAIASLKLGINVSVATPIGIEMDKKILQTAEEVSKETGASFEHTHDPKATATNANILVTDTFVSMGEESETAKKLKQFEGFQISEEHTKLANKDWKFMHCLPRHKEEVTDEVFYNKNSLVFEEAENRLYAAIAALEVFVVNKGDFSK